MIESSKIKIKRRLPEPVQKLVDTLDENRAWHLLSMRSLAKMWNTPAEDEAWKEL